MSSEVQLLLARILGGALVVGTFLLAFTVFKDNGPAAGTLTGFASMMVGWLGLKSPIKALHPEADEVSK